MSNPITPLSPAQTASQELKTAHENYIVRTLVAADIAANVAFGGHEDETISTRTAVLALQKNRFGILVSRFLDLFHKDHGADAAAGDLERAQAEVAALEADKIVNKK